MAGENPNGKTIKSNAKKQAGKRKSQPKSKISDPSGAAEPTSKIADKSGKKKKKK